MSKLRFTITREMLDERVKLLESYTGMKFKIQSWKPGDKKGIRFELFTIDSTGQLMNKIGNTIIGKSHFYDVLLALTHLQQLKPEIPRILAPRTPPKAEESFPGLGFHDNVGMI